MLLVGMDRWMDGVLVWFEGLLFVILCGDDDIVVVR